MESVNFTGSRTPGATPRVSVLLPNLNYARFVPEALLSRGAIAGSDCPASLPASAWWRTSTGVSRKPAVNM